jgi:metaxin
MSRLYVEPCSTNPFLRMALRHQLTHAAEAEALRATRANIIDARRIYGEAYSAFEALSTTLGDSNDWFFGGDGPSSFDCSVFAYTHLILDETLGWKDRGLVEALHSFPNLVKHRERILSNYWP